MLNSISFTAQKKVENPTFKLENFNFCEPKFFDRDNIIKDTFKQIIPGDIIEQKIGILSTPNLYLVTDKKFCQKIGDITGKDNKILLSELFKPESKVLPAEKTYTSRIAHVDTYA